MVRFDVSMTLNQPLVSELSVLRGMPSSVALVGNAERPQKQAERPRGLTECRESFKVLRGELYTPALAKPDSLITRGIR